jgi:hypothetical protein
MLIITSSCHSTFVANNEDAYHDNQGGIILIPESSSYSIKISDSNLSGFLINIDFREDSAQKLKLLSASHSLRLCPNGIIADGQGRYSLEGNILELEYMKESMGDKFNYLGGGFCFSMIKMRLSLDDGRFIDGKIRYTPSQESLIDRSNIQSLKVIKSKQ